MTPNFPFALEITELEGHCNNGSLQHGDYTTECQKGFLLRVNTDRKEYR